MDGQLRLIERRPPETVMRLSRMGSSHPTRLSFMRILLRRIEREAWQFDCPVWDIDERGVGRAVYRIRGPERTYSLVAFAHDLPDHLRSDRVIAEAWDATFALFDGTPTNEDIMRLEGNVPKQEAGRVSGRELTLSRANRSVRLFKHVVERLSAGQQPDADEIDKVGYLMRTTAVYGSGKFGLLDRDVYCGRPEVSAPFQAEMLTVWLIRQFTVDIAEHMARMRSSNAARLDHDLRQRLGVGNSTGLGMAPFLMTHPVLINNWMMAREEALARVRPLSPGRDQKDHFFRALAHATENAMHWSSEHPIQIEKLAKLRSDLDLISAHSKTLLEAPDVTWEALWIWGENELSLEGQEQLLALMLEPYGDLIDRLADAMSAEEDDAFAIDGLQSIASLRDSIEQIYAWALKTDWTSPETQARLWYVSEEKLEPRLAERAFEPLEQYEQPLAPARDVVALYRSLEDTTGVQSVGDLLVKRPQHRAAVRRVQVAAKCCYAEIRDNTIAHDMLPIDLLRAKLSFFGATRFDPRSDRWVRISMYQGAPFPDEIGTVGLDAWMYGA